MATHNVDWRVRSNQILMYGRKRHTCAKLLLFVPRILAWFLVEQTVRTDLELRCARLNSTKNGHFVDAKALPTTWFAMPIEQHATSESRRSLFFWSGVEHLSRRWGDRVVVIPRRARRYYFDEDLAGPDCYRIPATTSAANLVSEHCWPTKNRGNFRNRHFP